MHAIMLLHVCGLNVPMQPRRVVSAPCTQQVFAALDSKLGGLQAHGSERQP